MCAASEECLKRAIQERQVLSVRLARDPSNATRTVCPAVLGYHGDRTLLVAYDLTEPAHANTARDDAARWLCVEIEELEILAHRSHVVIPDAARAAPRGSLLAIVAELDRGVP